MKKQYSALYFYGGKKAVIKRMNGLVKEELTKRLDIYKDEHKSFLDDMVFETGVPEQQIFGILSGATQINYKLFELVGGYLGVEINNVLGEPDLSNPDAERYWKDQMRVKPMLISTDKPNINKRKLEKLEYHFYIKLMAISELAQAA
jgi:hypothetical protein